MPGLFSKLATKATGQVIEAAERNQEFDNIIAKFEPQYMDDQSANVAAMRATANPGEVNTESLATTLKGELERLRFAINEMKGTTYWYESLPENMGGCVPVGTVVAHYDFNAAVNITASWAYCNGAVVNDAASAFDGETLPDLSNRYLVGFGTEAGTDIDSAAWNVTEVGAASHEISLAHTHTGPSHTHTAEHNHQFLEITYVKGIIVSAHSWESDGSTEETWSFTNAANLDSVASGSDDIIHNPLDSFTKDTNATTSASGTGATGSNLSATQSIQPSSVRVRWIIRIK